MPENASLCAVARVPLVDPAGMLRKLCDHFVEHGTVTLAEGRGRIESPFGVAQLEAGTQELTMRADCPNEVALSIVKTSLAEHLVAFAGDAPPAFVWTGDQSSNPTIPYFHEMAVVGSYDVTPRMRRVTLAGVDPRCFDGGGLHVRILIPPKGRPPSWPRASEDGRVLWPKGEDALTSRVYTVRSIDHLRKTIDIDVVLHGGDRTPGATWAAQARAGDVVGVMGPGGGDVPDAGRLVLMGDETAIPAVARILEALPSGRRATVRLEVADRDDEQDLGSKATVDLRWIYRNGAEPGTTGVLPVEIRRLDWAAMGEDVYVLAGCEHADARAIRTFLRKEIGLPRDRHLVAAYWRRGVEGDEARSDE